MAQTYQFAVELSPATVQALILGNFSLLAFQPLQATAKGEPVVWIQVKELATTIEVGWSPVYAANVSNGLSSSTAPLKFGEILQVGQGASIKVTNDGPADAMSVLNTTSSQWTTSLYAMSDNPFPIATFPLYGSSMIAMAPELQVLFVFDSHPTQPGQILDRTLAQGALVDFSTGNQRSANFDINGGWYFGGQSWGQLIPPNTSLRELLIHEAPLALAEQVDEISRSLG